METGTVYAVLTGDLIGSSRFKMQERQHLLSYLKDSFKLISPEVIASPFVVFRGDSFQGVLSKPEEALKAALIIRASLLSRFKGKRTRLDARIAIGMGTIDYPRDQAGEGDGEAFRRSGPELDKMKKGEQNLIIKTQWIELNGEFQTECALLDAIIQRWTKEQAEAILYQIQRKTFLGGTPHDFRFKEPILGETTQEGIAKILSISQPALSQRLKTGGFWAVQLFLEHFKVIIRDKVRSGIRLKPYNHENKVEDL